MSRSHVDSDPPEARNLRQAGSLASPPTPPGEAIAASTPSVVGEWLLELGAATRQAESRSLRHPGEGHHRLRAWSSRRARRQVVRRALAGTGAAGGELEPSARPGMRQASESDPSREDTAEVPAVEVHQVALPPVAQGLAEGPAVIRLPPVQSDLPARGLLDQLGPARPELAEELGFAVVALSVPMTAPASLLLDRLSAYTMAPAARGG